MIFDCSPIVYDDLLPKAMDYRLYLDFMLKVVAASLGLEISQCVDLRYRRGKAWPVTPLKRRRKRWGKPEIEAVFDAATAFLSQTEGDES